MLTSVNLRHFCNTERGQPCFRDCPFKVMSLLPQSSLVKTVWKNKQKTIRYWYNWKYLLNRSFPSITGRNSTSRIITATGFASNQHRSTTSWRTATLTLPSAAVDRQPLCQHGFSGCTCSQLSSTWLSPTLPKKLPCKHSNWVTPLEPFCSRAPQHYLLYGAKPATHPVSKYA